MDEDSKTNKTEKKEKKKNCLKNNLLHSWLPRTVLKESDTKFDCLVGNS